MSEWIRVHDKLPEEGQPILASNGARYQIGYIIHQFYHCFTEYPFDIKYWMPLPEPSEN
ncbi:MAG TPA: DUF551 domain-containing protein [Candidatus Sulfopaludibacter sp.]|nr:DUF551 domain-containing protein [Candidatus Sulfopaludibacter sp.]